eukprot:612169_1
MCIYLYCCTYLWNSGKLKLVVLEVSRSVTQSLRKCGNPHGAELPVNVDVAEYARIAWSPKLTIFSLLMQTFLLFDAFPWPINNFAMQPCSIAQCILYHLLDC